MHMFLVLFIVKKIWKQYNNGWMDKEDAMCTHTYSLTHSPLEYYSSKR